MAEENGKNAVGLTTKWFGLNMSGRDAGFIFLFIAMAALTGYVAWEQKLRSDEHVEIEQVLEKGRSELFCIVKLNLFISQTSQRGEPINWQAMPADLYPCVPKFLYDKQSTPR